MDSLTNAQRRALLAELLDRLEHGKGLLPAPKPLPFNPVPGIATAKWSIFLAEELVQGDLREVTNQLNQWLGNLRRWHAWNDVLAKHEEDVRWDCTSEWVEPLAFHCMFQPSATRDRFILLATNALHQARMAIDPKIEDVLLGDATPTEKRFYPPRADKERQLKLLVKPWAAGKAFIQALGQLDDRGYRRVTADFRNRASHGIAPRFLVGHVSLVTRTRTQAMTLKELPDQTFMEVPVPGKMSTPYGYGGTPPLSMEVAWETNRSQFDHARRVFDAYVALLTEAVAAMPQRPERPPNAAPLA